MKDSIIIGIDCCGEWIKKNNRFVWHWNVGKMAETIAMRVQRDVVYDDFVNLIISRCELNCQSKDLVISYMHGSFENLQWVLPFKITDQVRLRAYFSDETRPILRVYMVKKSVENHNFALDQQDMLNDEMDGMDIPDNDSGDEVDGPYCGDDQTLTLDTLRNSQSTQPSHVQDDETGFYKGMSFKNKKELASLLKISCLKKDFRLMKVINSRSLYCLECVHPKCMWWLRAVKLLNCDRFCIRSYIKYHTCGSKHIMSHNPHAKTKIIGEFFKDKFPDIKVTSKKDTGHQIRTKLGCMEIHPMPSEESCNVPLEILEGEIYLHVDPSKPRRNRARKYKCSICKMVRHYRTTCQTEMLQNC